MCISWGKLFISLIISFVGMKTFLPLENCSASPIWQYMQSKLHTLPSVETASTPRDLPSRHDATGPYRYLYFFLIPFCLCQYHCCNDSHENCDNLRNRKRSY